MTRLLAVALLLLAACGPAEDAAQQPQRLPTMPIAIQTEQGAVALIVQVANTPEETATGLMWVKEMPANHGMLFNFPESEVQSFWMRNTFIPLDILFIGANGRIMHIHENARPHDETGINSRFPVALVLEVNAGFVAKHAVAVGDIVIVAKPAQSH